MNLPSGNIFRMVALALSTWNNRPVNREQRPALAEHVIKDAKQFANFIYNGDAAPLKNGPQEKP